MHYLQQQSSQNAYKKSFLGSRNGNHFYYSNFNSTVQPRFPRQHRDSEIVILSQSPNDFRDERVGRGLGGQRHHFSRKFECQRHKSKIWNGNNFGKYHGNDGFTRGNYFNLKESQNKRRHHGKIWKGNHTYWGMQNFKNPRGPDLDLGSNSNLKMIKTEHEVNHWPKNKVQIKKEVISIDNQKINQKQVKPNHFSKNGEYLLNMLSLDIKKPQKEKNKKR